MVSFVLPVALLDCFLLLLSVLSWLLFDCFLLLLPLSVLSCLLHFSIVFCCCLFCPGCYLIGFVVVAVVSFVLPVALLDCFLLLSVLSWLLFDCFLLLLPLSVLSCLLHFSIVFCCCLFCPGCYLIGFVVVAVVSFVLPVALLDCFLLLSVLSWLLFDWFLLLLPLSVLSCLLHFSIVFCCCLFCPGCYLIGFVVVAVVSFVLPVALLDCFLLLSVLSWLLFDWFCCCCRCQFCLGC